jgi:hypothetical protein
VDHRSREVCGRAAAGRADRVSDIHIGEDCGGAQTWALRDGPARDDEDLGDVYQGGELVGR